MGSLADRGVLDQDDSMHRIGVNRDRENREDLVRLIAGAIRQDGIVDPLDGVRLTRASEPTERVYGVSKPSLCIIAQGAKEVYLGDSRYAYDSEKYFLATVELPVTGRVVEASREIPYLAIRIDLEPVSVGSVMVEAGLPAAQGPRESKAIVVSALDADLLDATVRLARLIHAPADARILAPMVKREIIYRLLVGEQGSRLRHVPMLGGQSDRIVKALEQLRRNFDKPLRIDSLARELGMSSSGFHQHFKMVTDMSPLQYQKQLRLQEARRVMLGESLDAASAGYRVGYEDASHFSRDYKRLFGEAPGREIERLRSMVSAD